MFLISALKGGLPFLPLSFPPFRNRVPRWPFEGGLIPLLLFACDGGSHADVGFTEERFGDTIHVHSFSPVFSEPAILEPEIRIGSQEGEDELLFIRVRSIAVGPDGEIYVGGLEGEGIREFDASGTFVRWVARSGRGPMEVGQVSALTVSPRGVLAAKDRSNHRITLFYPDGQIRNLPQPQGHERYGEDGLLFHTDGTLWVGIHPPLSQRGPIPYPRAIFTRLSVSGESPDTVFAPERLGELCPLLGDYRYMGGVWVDKREPWFPMGEWASGPNGELALGCPSDYSFDVLRKDGSVLRISRDWTPVRTFPEEAEHKAKYEVVLYPGALKTPPLPELRPAYARIIIPGDGRIWVWPVQPSQQVRLPDDMAEASGRDFTWHVGFHGAFDVFQEDGRWLGKVQIPEEFHYSGYPVNPPPAVIRGDTIWGMVQDSFDVQYVQRYRVVWPGANF